MDRAPFRLGGTCADAAWIELSRDRVSLFAEAYFSGAPGEVPPSPDGGVLEPVPER